MSTPEENLRLAKRGPIVSIVAYMVITLLKLITGYFLNSSSLIADGFNNLSDILGNVVLWSLENGRFIKLDYFFHHVLHWL